MECVGCDETCVGTRHKSVVQLECVDTIEVTGHKSVQQVECAGTVNTCEGAGQRSVECAGYIDARKMYLEQVKCIQYVVAGSEGHLLSSMRKRNRKGKFKYKLKGVDSVQVKLDLDVRSEVEEIIKGLHMLSLNINNDANSHTNPAGESLPGLQDVQQGNQQLNIDTEYSLTRSTLDELVPKTSIFCLDKCPNFSKNKFQVEGTPNLFHEFPGDFNGNK